MNVAGALDSLAERYGIESEFVDAHGVVQQTSPQAKRSLLAALGARAETDAAAQVILDECETADWQSGLPPVVVAEREHIRVPLVLPHGSGNVAWRLALEAGGELAAIVAFADLTLLASANRGGQLFERRELVLPPAVAHGYHRLSVDSSDHVMTLIVTPGRCWLPPAIEAGARLSGIAVQLYLLRSDDNWGIGDFTDLRKFVELLAEHGADIVGLNPLHQMFFDDPEHASPYSPASRLLLNVLNIDVGAIPEYATSEPAQVHVRGADFAAQLAACRSARLVDYSGVSKLKLAVLRLVFATFRAQFASQRQAEFARYRSRSSRTMQRTCIFLALREHFAARDQRRAAWQTWPAQYRDPESPAVVRFARDNADEVAFIAWLQWVADAQLEAAACAARSMRVGLYRDLAVGADPAGAETWINAQAVVSAARVGAPPDIHNTAGQNWDLPPFHPRALREEAYQSFIELVRANMRHAGGLRIDHVMALQHSYWIPQGAAPADGAYVRYPLADLVGILALESERAKCLVVGEDLGTVPAGFRERMAAANVLSYRVLFFERATDEQAAFLPPDAYPTLAVAVLGSHDLPTLAAWWDGADIRLREKLGLPRAAATAQQRVRDREALVAGLRSAGVLAAGRALEGDALFAAAHAFLSATESALALAQIDDLTDETDPVNVPTTSDEYPNWRRRLSRSIEELPADARFAALFAVFRAAGRLRRDLAQHADVAAPNRNAGGVEKLQ